MSRPAAPSVRRAAAALVAITTLEVCDAAAQCAREASTCFRCHETASVSPGGCPASTHAARRDIRYSPAPGSRHSLLNWTACASRRTSTWTRRSVGHAGSPSSSRTNPVPFGEDAAHSEVDLYGHASTLAAAVQVRGRRMDALEAEVRALREAEAR
jgi:hypothetical protein